MHQNVGCASNAPIKLLKIPMQLTLWRWIHTLHLSMLGVFKICRNWHSLSILMYYYKIKDLLASDNPILCTLFLNNILNMMNNRNRTHWRNLKGLPSTFAMVWTHTIFLNITIMLFNQKNLKGPTNQFFLFKKNHQLINYETPPLLTSYHFEAATNDQDIEISSWNGQSSISYNLHHDLTPPRDRQHMPSLTEP